MGNSRVLGLVCVGISAFLAMGVVGCGNSSPTQAPFVPPTPVPMQYVYFPATLANGTGAILDAGTTATGTGTPNTAITNGNGGLGYLCVDGAGDFYAVQTAEGTGNSTFAIVEYGAGTGGAAIPSRTIAGSATGLVASTVLVSSSNYPLGVDTKGNIAVAMNGAGLDAIEYFSSTATGNVAPTATITVPAAFAGTITRVVVSPSGAISVLNQEPGSKGYQVLTFAAGANGTTTPTVVASFPATTLADGLFADGSGNLYVASTAVTSVGGVLTGLAPTIQEFAPGATTATKTITPTNDPVRMFGMQLDSSGNLFVLCEDLSLANLSVQSFASGASGSSSPASTISFVGLLGSDGSLALH